MEGCGGDGGGDEMEVEAMEVEDRWVDGGDGGGA